MSFRYGWSRRVAFPPGFRPPGTLARAARILACLHLVSCVGPLLLAGSARATSAVFPGATWARRTPAEVGLDSTRLNQFAAAVGGVGVIVKDGYLVKTWGDPSSKDDWASAAKPVVATMLFFAVHEGKLPGVDALLRPFWTDGLGNDLLLAKDRTMTFRHLADMTSGYARGESPGAAWAYNDYAIRLYKVTLFDRVFHEGTPNDAATKPTRLGALQFEDGSIFSSRGGYGVYTSPRDFARIGWFWLNKGNWNGQQLLPQSFFDTCMRPDVPGNLPRTLVAGSDYLGVGTDGGGSDQTPYGPGIYGFNWWFNAPVGTTAVRTWPDAPADAFQANGHWNREVMTIIPSQGMVVAARGDWGTFEPGNAASTMNQNLKLLKINRVPVVAAPSTVSGVENSSVSVTGSASDPDGQNVTLSQTNSAPFLAGPASAGPSLNPRITLAGTPGFTQSGSYPIKWTATDGAGGTASTTTVLSIANLNHAPTVSAPVTAAVDEGVLLAFSVSVADADGDPVALTAAGAALTAGGTFTYDEGTASGGSRTFSWTPDYTAAARSPYSVTFSADDGAGGTASATTSITVNNASRAPAVAAPASVAGHVLAPLSCVVTASDPDGDPIASLTAAPLPAGATFTANETNTSGTLIWTPGVGQAGVYDVVFMASEPLEGTASTRITVDSVSAVETSEPPAVPRAVFAEPNPFERATVFAVRVPKSGRVIGRVYDISGRLIRTLVDEDRPRGSLRVTWNGETDRGIRAASGTYFCWFTLPDETRRGQVVRLIR